MTVVSGFASGSNWQSASGAQWKSDTFGVEGYDGPGSRPIESRPVPAKQRGESGPIFNLTLLITAVAAAAVMTRAPVFAEPAPSKALRSDGPAGNPTLIAASTQVQSPFFVLPDGFKRAAQPRDDGPKRNALLPLGLGSTVAPAMTRAALEPHRWSPPWRDDGPKRGIAPLGIGQGSQASVPFTVLEAARARVPAPRADGPTVSQALVYAVQLYSPWDGANEPRKAARPSRQDGPVSSTLYVPGEAPASAYLRTETPPAKRSVQVREDGPGRNLVALGAGVGESAAPAMTRATLEPHRWSPPWRDDGPKRGIAPLGIGQGAQASVPFTVLDAVRTRVPAPRADGPTVSQALVYAVQLYSPWDGANEPRKAARPNRQDGPVSSTLYVPGEAPASAYLRTETPPAKRSVQAREDGPGRNLVALGAGVGESAAPAATRTIHFPVPRSKANRDDGPVKGILPLGIGRSDPATVPTDSTAGGGGRATQWLPINRPTRRPDITGAGDLIALPAAMSGRGEVHGLSSAQRRRKRLLKFLISS